MTVLVAIVFTVMAACALGSAFVGALMVLGLKERSKLNQLAQIILFAEAVQLCIIGLILILGTNA